jgi:pimeloyl-ACP methyl ester carboxylesterase
MKKLAWTVLGLLVLLLLLFVGGIAATWAPDRSVDSLKARWAPPPSAFVSVQGMQVHLRDEGPREDPQPLVLLHGTSASLHTWDGWVEGLKGTRRVIRMDLPGFGLTGPHPRDDYAIDSYAQFVVAVMDALAVKQAVLAGNSLGGEIAWTVAVLHPQRVSRLVLIDSAGYPFTPTSIPLGFRIARVPVLKRLMDHTLPRALVASSVRNVYGDPSKVTDALIDRYAELTLREGNRAALVKRLAHPLGQHSQRIAQIRQPTLVLWGRLDRLIPLASGERFARDIPGAQLRVFDALGHVPQEEDPAATLAATLAFLDAAGAR